jgi:quercetin dioxygenase-like cupin family protein
MIESNDNFSGKDKIQKAEVVLSCSDLDETLSFYTDTLGFRVEAIFPADDPNTAVISGYGLRLCLHISDQPNPAILRLYCSIDIDKRLSAPNGVTIELLSSDPPLTIPDQDASFVITRFDQSSHWHTGRAGMRYRDLIPNRQGGRFIASHIHIPNPGPVADYVHYHKVRFQMIFCYKGWVKLVYEDQGPEFILGPGDCVIQPPQIRHRVLESSGDLEVVEIGCPAEHETHADLVLELPNDNIDTLRDFSGQQFVRHQCADAEWSEWRIDGFEARDLGIGNATNGMAGAYVVRPSSSINSSTVKRALIEHKEEFLMLFILSGQLDLNCPSEGNLSLNTGDTCVIPENFAHSFGYSSDDFEMLEVRFSDNFKTCPVTA